MMNEKDNSIYKALVIVIILILSGSTFYFYQKSHKIDRVIDNTDKLTMNVVDITDNIKREELSAKEALEVFTRTAIDEGVNQMVQRGPEVAEVVMEVAVDKTIDVGARMTRKATSAGVSMVKDAAVSSYSGVSEWWNKEDESSETELEVEIIEEVPEVIEEVTTEEVIPADEVVDEDESTTYWGSVKNWWSGDEDEDSEADSAETSS